MSWNTPFDLSTGQSITNYNWNSLLGKNGSLQYIRNYTNIQSVILNASSFSLISNVEQTIFWSNVISTTNTEEYIQVPSNSSNIVFLKSGFYEIIFTLYLETSIVIGPATGVCETSLNETTTWKSCIAYDNQSEIFKIIHLPIYIKDANTTASFSLKSTVNIFGTSGVYGNDIVYNNLFITPIK